MTICCFCLIFSFAQSITTQQSKSAVNQLQNLENALNKFLRALLKIQLHNRVEHLLKPNTGTSQYLPGKAVEPCDFMHIIPMPTIASCWFTELSSAIITTPYKTGSSSI